MGRMRFRVFPPERITAEMIEQAYLSGFDRESWPVQIDVEGGELILERLVSDSANLHVPWPVEGHGGLALSSGSLMERPEPYLLPLELARGSIVQVRNQLADWQLLGLAVPEPLSARMAEAVSRFSLAAVTQDDPAVWAAHAEAALRLALDAGDALVTAYTQQVLAFRLGSEGKLASWLGADLGTTLLDDPLARQFRLAFNAAEVPLCWRETEASEGRYSWSVSDQQIKWCRTHGLKVLAGPLLMLDPHLLPDWLCLFEGDFDSLADFAARFVRQTVERYRGQVDAWLCAGRVNSADVLSLSEPRRLRLIAHVVELVHSLDPGTPAIVSFDQPWAEYLRRQVSDFPPLHLADALIRGGAGISGLMLELDVGYSQGGTMLRHSLEFNRLLDTWGGFGLPLWLSICAPGSDLEDPLARRKTTMSPNTWTPAAQQTWVAKMVPLLLVKPIVQGLVWNQLLDNQVHDFPNAGLFDERKQAKPALRTLASIRQTHLK